MTDCLGSLGTRTIRMDLVKNAVSVYLYYSWKVFLGLLLVSVEARRLGGYRDPMRINKCLLIDRFYDSAIYKNDFDFCYQNHTLVLTKVRTFAQLPISIMADYWSTRPSTPLCLLLQAFLKLPEFLSRLNFPRKESAVPIAWNWEFFPR